MNNNSAFSQVLREANTSVAERWSVIDTKVIKVKYTWVLSNFSYCLGEDPISIFSTIFSGDDNQEFNWSLHIKERKDHFSLYLYLNTSALPEVKTKFKFSILNSEGNEAYTKKTQTSQRLTAISYKGFENFISRDFLLNEANGLLPDDKLTILCEVGFVRDTDVTSDQFYIDLLKEPDCKLIENFARLLDNDAFSDIMFFVKDHQIQAHKAILAVRSDVFAAMFAHKMQESKLNRVIVSDIDPEVFKEMLRFIYTDNVSNLSNMAVDLLAAADKYALEKLKILCEKELCDNITVETAAEISILADLHSAALLKEQTLEFIKKHAVDVMRTQGWIDMIKRRDS